MERFSDVADGNEKWIYQPPRWLLPPRVPNIEVGAEMRRDWMMSMLNVGCVRLILRGFSRVILYSSDDAMSLSLC